MRKMTEKEKNFHRNYQQMKRDLKKESANPFLFLLEILDNGGDTYIKQFLRYVKNKNWKVFKELYNGIKYRFLLDEVEE
jgi:hypothetical protein